MRPENARDDDYGKLRQLLAEKVEELVQRAVSETVAPLLGQLQVLMAQVEAQDATIRQMQKLGQRSLLAERWHSGDLVVRPGTPRLRITATGSTQAVVETPEAAYLQGLQHALDEYQIRTMDLGVVSSWGHEASKEDRLHGERYGGVLNQPFDDSVFSDDDINKLINDLSRDTDLDGLSFTES